MKRNTSPLTSAGWALVIACAVSLALIILAVAL